MTRQKIEPPTAEEEARIDRQRTWVRDHYDPQSRYKYASVEGKLRLIETILEEKWIEPDETWKLQSLGVTFGDALAQELDFFWVTVEDERGRDPGLHDANGSTIVLFPLTTISKRIERGERVDVRKLFAAACEIIARIRSEQSGRPLN